MYEMQKMSRDITVGIHCKKAKSDFRPKQQTSNFICMYVCTVYCAALFHFRDPQSDLLPWRPHLLGDGCVGGFPLRFQACAYLHMLMAARVIGKELCHPFALPHPT